MEWLRDPPGLIGLGSAGRPVVVDASATTGIVFDSDNVTFRDGNRDDRAYLATVRYAF
jgi:hypothetical protein